MIQKEILRDELPGYNGLTVGELRRYLNENPHLDDKAPVLIERVEDVYYEKHNWGVFLSENEYTLKNEDGTPIKETMSQYHPAFCCFHKLNDNGIVYINLHY